MKNRGFRDNSLVFTKVILRALKYVHKIQLCCVDCKRRETKCIPYVVLNVAASAKLF